MNSAQNGNHAQASKLAPPDSSWTYKESGVHSGSVATFDNGHEEQNVSTDTRAYFDKNGVNKRIVKAVTTLTKKVVVSVLYDADTQTVGSHSDDNTSSRESSPAPPFVSPTTTCTPSPAVIVAAALAAQGSGLRSRNIDHYFIPHGSSRSNSSARTVVRIRPRTNGTTPSNIASGSGSGPVANGEHIHGPRPRPLHVLDDEEVRRPSKKRKRDTSADVSSDA
ncbi:hypothetical protein HYPSUDRAFT_60285 [Hypholoma sublateritium FD-334 SS-4]|uniref:Uncharacterized protein n=1 Tax=Hypholoma sublateritium (strain FD-334 SS-4) TaxID=945553 RepID=A0A0D2NVZ7_HYPSF|nr:hypothetical protein HYPSUDRAFT_60285 [Hypholoma sublateritium FD-334 SS-4]